METDPVGIEVATDLAPQVDRSSRGEVNPEGLEEAETMEPQESRREIDTEGIEVAEPIRPQTRT